MAARTIKARAIAELGHQVKLIAPKYVKPFVKRQKNDLTDAEAICEAALRPTMRFVPVKTETAQASALVFRARDLLVRQRTQTTNALRGHLMEYGRVAPKSAAHVAKLVDLIEDPASELPEEVRSFLGLLVASLKDLNDRIAGLDVQITKRQSRSASPSADEHSWSGSDHGDGDRRAGAAA